MHETLPTSIILGVKPVMAKRTRNRMELRDQFEASERIKQDDETVEDEDEDADEESDADEEEDGEEADEESDAVAEVEIDPDAEEEEEVKPVKKKRKKAAPKEPKPKRVRASKVTRSARCLGRLQQFKSARCHVSIPAKERGRRTRRPSQGREQEQSNALRSTDQRTDRGAEGVAGVAQLPRNV